jgi:outer membrane biogenesis lipoprotein LolB
VTLPSGTGTATTEYSEPFAAASAECRDVRTLQAELGLAGNAGRQKLRGRVLAGFAPGAMRLEAVAPFGSPAFILVADGSRGTLLLPRDRRVLQNAAPEEILEALIGLTLGPDDLRAALSGCAKAGAEPKSGREYGPEWMSMDLASGGTVYLRRQASVWRLVAARYAGVDIEYVEFTGVRPSQIVIRASNATLIVSLRQVEVNGDLPHDQLVAVNVAPGLQPMTLEELREAGPLGSDK